MIQEYNNIFEKPEEPGWWQLIKLILLAIITVWVLMSLGACQMYRTIEVVRDKYHCTTDTLHDSIYHDVYRNVYVQGDTVYNTSMEYIYKWKYQSKTDTVIQRDTIPSYSTVTKYVEKEAELSWWQRALMLMGAIAGLYLLITTISFIRFCYKY